MKKNILITGISGMLGNSVYKYFVQNKDNKIFGVSRNPDYALPKVEMLHGDLASDEFIESLEEFSFDYIIHCSAEVNVNLCETDKNLAYMSNVTSTKNLFSKIKSKKYLYISTDSVFDGQSGNYDEDSVTNPLNYYATTKLLGEDAVKDAVDNYYILRTNIFGFKKPLKKSLFEWAYTELTEGNTINGFNNMYFNPMYVGQIAQFINEILISDASYGTYNVGVNEKISKYEFLIKIAQNFNFSSDKINKKEFNPNDFVAPRALNTTLNNSKAKLFIKDFDYSLDSSFLMLKEDFKQNNIWIK
jgi:dTDP-4-dehydrorhamnose reductase